MYEQVAIDCRHLCSTHKEEYTWRIDLTKTEPFWKGWFEGLSALFLSIPVPKTLILAGVDRLDRDLTIGQMQGTDLGLVCCVRRRRQPRPLPAVILGQSVASSPCIPNLGLEPNEIGGVLKGPFSEEYHFPQLLGKFQMQVLSGCGHLVHEDVPEKVSEIIAGFLMRHKFAQPKEGFQRYVGCY